MRAFTTIDRPVPIDLMQAEVGLDQSPYTCEIGSTRESELSEPGTAELERLNLEGVVRMRSEREIEIPKMDAVPFNNFLRKDIEGPAPVIVIELIDYFVRVINREGKDEPEDRSEKGVEETVDGYCGDKVSGLKTPNCSTPLVFWDPERNGLADGENNLWQRECKCFLEGHG